MKARTVFLISIILVLTVFAGCLEGESEKEKDSDGDGIPDFDDAFPENPNEWSDMDGDGVGDFSDEFPKDSNETVDGDGDGVGDNGDEFPEDATRSRTEYHNVTLDTISGWLENDGSPTHKEEIYLENTHIFEVTFKVHVEDSDEEHAESDEGSDLDEVKTSVENEDGSLSHSQELVTPETMTVTFEAYSLEYEDLLADDWNITLQGLEFGGGKTTYAGFGFIVYTDQGVAWTIDVDYVYCVFE